ncbi:Zinc finger CCCH domain-containing protein 7A [Collichthys lucidus]|uniref:Zinc finger CCCH domain-containing protein 7A n=1 Tax=Collichthys lucidus TaxID=240159 RepID=A0A4U5VTY0_COLLU|nr:Zinc finger CCCH domain-containing protein 7A [Collichthys lucidus]
MEKLSCPSSVYGGQHRAGVDVRFASVLTEEWILKRANMSGPCQDRRIRWQEIQKGLQFIQSTLPFPGSQEQYEVFIKELVWNLFGEGNDVFKEGEWTKSIEMYTEALSIADYADSEEICVPTGLLEKLYANRAAAYLNIVPGLYDQALEDCEKALQLNEGNYRALYRKARSLKELGRHQEAYEAVAKCSLAVPQDSFVTQLTQDLAKLLGLKIRKAYVRSKKCLSYLRIAVSLLLVPSPIQAPVPASSLFTCPVSVPTSVPLPVPTFVNGCRTSKPCPMLETSQDFAADIIGDDLDDLLDQAGPKSPLVIPTVKGPLPLPTSIASGKFHVESIPDAISHEPISQQFPAVHGNSATAVSQLNNNEAPMGMAVGMPEVKGLPTPVGSAKNPLAETHEFRQACSVCYVKTEVAVGKECLYPGHCTFAYCQEEIDVWTLERKGFISRELLFDPYGPNSNVRLTVPKILQEHHGIFMFLCGVCFDHKPRIISKTNKDDPSLCSHPVTKHDFEDHKCLVHILKENTVRYSKIRPLSPQCQLDLCRHEVRYGCCWRNGQLSEADKNKKYCTAKARHTWAKDRRVVLVSSHERKKWTTVRPLPTKKPIPSQFEICMHVTAGKKCQYIGNCTFAHSVEERDLWTYMKENNIPDMDQLYEQWLQSQKLGWGEESSNNSVRENGKQIHMPTDYAEEVAGNHCWLCGKNCNSEKQWQQHITSEKHKDRVFNSEDDQNCWQYRFPTGTFKVCERYLKGTCTEDDLCKLAHGVQELKEWMERREFLSLKLAKARKDHLIAPNDNDFGKYSFLLKDIM